MHPAAENLFCAVRNTLQNCIEAGWSKEDAIKQGATIFKGIEVLCSELGRDGHARAVAEFQRRLQDELRQVPGRLVTVRLPESCRMPEELPPVRIDAPSDMRQFLFMPPKR
jgi:hypothetical protein